ncbi:hypothetical protein CRUP_017474 [Coryphaenoides rupestris]|nr:hypothetical protein CRUP_017474 [Coryphaenoides rupestris]
MVETIKGGGGGGVGVGVKTSMGGVVDGVVVGYGKIVSTKAILDKTTNKCKGYGFVDFDSPATAQKAVAALKSNGYGFVDFDSPATAQKAVAALKSNGVQAQMAKKKRQSQNKFVQNGRGWLRDNEARLAGMTLTYDPTTAAMQNGCGSTPASRSDSTHTCDNVNTAYHHVVARRDVIVVQNPWMQHQPYIMQHPGAVLSPSMDPTMSLQPTSIMAPLSQQMSHLSLGNTGTFMAANSAMQGAYLPQYAHMQTASLPLEDSGAQSQVDPSGELSPYAYQQNK